MTEECPVCKERVELTKVEEHDNHKNRFYSCGHTSKLFKVNITEIVGLPQLSGSKGIEIRPKTSGVVPVTISGDSGAKLDGFLDPHLDLKRIGQNVEFNAPVNLFIADSLSYQSITSTQNISHVDTTFNFTSIIDQVNTSDHSPEEKEMIKQILELLQRELPTKPLPGILDNIKTKFKEWFPMASPFIQQGIGLYFQAG